MAGFGCGDGLYCQSFLQKCVARSVDYNSNSACDALRVHATAEDAKRAGIAMSFSAGSSGGAGAYLSYETGVVYGDDGEFGCFATACAGNQSDVSIGNFANFGIYDGYQNFVGFSAVTNQGVDTPFINLGFQTSQVFSAEAPQSPNQILKNRIVGTTSGLTFGVGLSPLNIGSALCYTARLDAGDPLREFANIESLLTDWGRLGFAPEHKPSQLDGGGNRQPLPPAIGLPSRPAPPGAPAVGSAPTAGQLLANGSQLALRSLNYPDRYVRHRNFLADLTPVTTDLDRADSTFVVRNGLAGTGLSFESVNYPRHYLRHQGFRLKLAPLENSDLYRKDATFISRAGLADANGVSFESLNYPGYFIRHTGFQLVINQDSGGPFRADATFAPAGTVSSTVSGANAESTCYGMVQGRVAWNRNGARDWNDSNVRALCAGTRDPNATIRCFSNGIQAHDDWNRAIGDCAGRY